jgi:hypothetical protein
MTNNGRKTNVEKGKQGFQETSKSEASTGLGDLQAYVDAPDYTQPFDFDGAPNESTRNDIVNASISSDGDLSRVLTNLSPERARFHADAIRHKWQNIGNPEEDSDIVSSINYAIGENLSLGRYEQMKKFDPEWEPVEVKNDGSYNSYTGCKYERGMDTKDAAKLIRADLAKAQKSGLIPKAKYSVRVSRYTGGSAVQVTGTVEGDPSDFYDVTNPGYDDRRLAQTEAKNRIEEISSQYTYTRVATGYNEGGGANFYQGASMEIDGV